MKIWITAPFQELYLEKLKKDNEVCYENWFDTGIVREGKELAKLLNEKGTEIFVTEEDVVQKDVFEQCPTLKMLVVCRAGTSNIDLDAAKRNNVIVVNTPGRNAVGVAEMVVGMMISVSRNFYKGEKMIRDGGWTEDYYFKSFGTELDGSTVGFVGFGNVAKETAKRLSAFNMRILAYDPYVSAEAMKEYGAEKTEDLKKLVSESDYVSNHLPVTPDTRGMLDKELLSNMKKTAYFINSARTATTNEEDVLDLLREKKIAGAAFDVYGKEPLSADSPYLELENTELLPHIGGSTYNAIAKHSKMCFEAVKAFTENTKIDNRVV